jgi:hypothetical protein
VATVMASIHVYFPFHNLNISLLKFYILYVHRIIHAGHLIARLNRLEAPEMVGNCTGFPV